MPTKIKAFRNACFLYVFLFSVWGLYRYLVELPFEIEELFLKPIIWLSPTLLLLKKEKLGLSSVGVTLENLFPALYFAIMLGTIFAIEALLLNFLKYGGFQFEANLGGRDFTHTLGFSFLTAIVEEVTFRGYIFNRISFSLGHEWVANIITSLGWVVLVAPLAVFRMHIEGMDLLLYLGLSFLYSIGAGFVFGRTKNIASPILLHVLWEAPIILFR